MSVQLTPKGTRGVRMPKLPQPAWEFIHMLMNLRMKLRGANLLHLTTVGSKTGQERTVPLRWFPDGQDGWLIVASMGGAAKHPAWYINLAKTPDKVWIQVGNEKIKVRGESLHGEERAKLWEKIVAAAPGYGEYQTKTDREIPVVRLTRS